MEGKTRWEATVNKELLGAYSLDNGAGGYNTLTVKIEEVKTTKIKTAKGDEVKTVAFLVGQKPMVLNRTNMKMLTRLFKSYYLEDWAGKSIVLEVKKVNAFGEWMEALRISSILPQLPELTPTHEKWKGAKKAVLAGTTPIEVIKQHYRITPENEALLCEK